MWLLYALFLCCSVSKPAKNMKQGRFQYLIWRAKGSSHDAQKFTYIEIWKQSINALSCSMIKYWNMMSVACNQ